MIHPRFIPVVLKGIFRHRTRTALTVGGVACAMFLFVSIEAMQRGVERATEVSAGDDTLVVYRAERYCPMTSNLPQYYGKTIEGMDGVASVVPMRILVTNCRTSLDVVTFRGVPRDSFVEAYASGFELLAGSIEQWQHRSDAVLVGEALAQRRGFRAGDRFDAAGITVYVAGIFRSDQPQDQNVAYAHLDFIQQNAGQQKLGIVTQFNVKVVDHEKLESVAAGIDEAFRHDQEPTATFPEKAFTARAVSDAMAIVGFTRWLSYGCLFAVLALVGNAIVLSVQDRIRDHAVLQTLGYRGGLIARMVLTEGVVLGLAGGVIGSFGAWALSYWGRFSLSTEGLSLSMDTSPLMILVGLLVAIALGALAGLAPAWRASRREIAACFRAV